MVPARASSSASSAPCSPRERGWSLIAPPCRSVRAVLPARAGMVPGLCLRRSPRRGAPRASGDGPERAGDEHTRSECSPRERGWSLTGLDPGQLALVLPARAGMVPLMTRGHRQAGCAPRASGDGPDACLDPTEAGLCSPRERGWSLGPHDRLAARQVLPARAGMVPSGPNWRGAAPRAPRASGDGPAARFIHRQVLECSPRERGWSLGGLMLRWVEVVLPARAGMVPARTLALRPSRRAPRASGDGPATPGRDLVPALCSPRERGWSRCGRPGVDLGGVLPARAGMVPRTRRRRGFAMRAPRASGDGPGAQPIDITEHLCSPRERGWSVGEGVVDRGGHVLPARAGMVPSRPSASRCPTRAPRASGDGPPPMRYSGRPPQCSPRERGWSRLLRAQDGAADVLPARAGMVPEGRSPGWVTRRAPRASGDGPSGTSVSSWTRWCSPRERGWSQVLDRLPVVPEVLPARAGMVPCRRASA